MNPPPLPTSPNAAYEHAILFFQDHIRDITDSLIDHCEDRKLDENSNVQMSDEKIVGIVNDLFGAGRLHFFSS